MKIITVILLVCLCCQAQSPKKDETPAGNLAADSLMIDNTPQPHVSIGGTYIIEIDDKDDALMVRVDRDGKITYGKGYSADASAKTFWELLAKYYPVVCKREELPPPAPAEHKPESGVKKP
jgi:hypothetical protein